MIIWLNATSQVLECCRGPKGCAQFGHSDSSNTKQSTDAMQLDVLLCYYHCYYYRRQTNISLSLSVYGNTI